MVAENVLNDRHGVFRLGLGKLDWLRGVEYVAQSFDFRNLLQSLSVLLSSGEGCGRRTLSGAVDLGLLGSRAGGFEGRRRRGEFLGALLGESLLVANDWNGGHVEGG